jgi:hypothetical protein
MYYDVTLWRVRVMYVSSVYANSLKDRFYGDLM